MSKKKEIPRRPAGLTRNDKGLPPLKTHVILTTTREKNPLSSNAALTVQCHSERLCLEESPAKRALLYEILSYVRDDIIVILNRTEWSEESQTIESFSSEWRKSTRHISIKNFLPTSKQNKKRKVSTTTTPLFPASFAVQLKTFGAWFPSDPDLHTTLLNPNPIISSIAFLFYTAKIRGCYSQNNTEI